MLDAPDIRSTRADEADRIARTPSRWQRIASALRDEIAAGLHAPGAQLPNESALAARFGVHRHTLRQAVRQLVHEGHLRVVQGSGTYVRELVLDYALKRRTRMTENLAEAGERAQRELLGHATEPAGDWAAPLHLARTDEVLLLHTLAVVRGRPVGLSTSAYPAARLGDMADAFVRHGSVTRALAELGVADYVRARSTVSCRLPSAAEADALARPATEPVLVVQYVNVDGEGRPVEAARTVFASDAVQLSVAHDGETDAREVMP
ncbi:phosphonate metabolism transcriptional regulator PhnF [Ideonella sp. DXS22W]|uniref:Phosphonate metabolism transcriptional regulator PhnF n=1 Tax=Pseudaquabacterium inlustre TaxID=2984192 RepID=A0ABU9CEI2_9BURK